VKVANAGITEPEGPGPVAIDSLCTCGDKLRCRSNRGLIWRSFSRRSQRTQLHLVFECLWAWDPLPCCKFARREIEEEHESCDRERNQSLLKH
jgi:hypothetical protein